jgi:hypothetical protein
MNSIIGKKRPNVFLLVQKSKEEKEFCILSAEVKRKPGQPGQKPRKTYVNKTRELKIHGRI